MGISRSSAFLSIKYVRIIHVFLDKISEWALKGNNACTYYNKAWKKKVYFSKRFIFTVMCFLPAVPIYTIHLHLLIDKMLDWWCYTCVIHTPSVRICSSLFVVCPVLYRSVLRHMYRTSVQAQYRQNYVILGFCLSVHVQLSRLSPRRQRRWRWWNDGAIIGAVSGEISSFFVLWFLSMSHTLRQPGTRLGLFVAPWRILLGTNLFLRLLDLQTSHCDPLPIRRISCISAWSWHWLLRTYRGA